MFTTSKNVTSVTSTGHPVTVRVVTTESLMHRVKRIFKRS